MSPKHITMLIVSLALFLDVMDSNVINTAIPAISETFNVTPIDLKIALISYLLSLAIFIPMSGWTADQYGAKNIFIAAVGLFTVSSFFCGYSHTLPELIIARSVQGVGGAFMISLGRFMVAKTFLRHEMIQATSTMIIVISSAVMMGPFVGGVIVDHWSWPWIFWINIPAGAFVVLLSLKGLKETGTKNPRPFDFFGFVLFGGGLALLSFSVSAMSEAHRELRSSFFELTLALFMLIIYVFHARRNKHPVIQINLLKIRTFRISIYGSLFGRLGFGGIPFLIPLLQQVGLGFSAQLSGLLMIPLAIGVIASKMVGPGLLRKTGYRRFLYVNTVLVGLSLWLFQIITSHTPIDLIATLTFIFGFIVSLQYTGMNSLALADIKDEQLSAATTITSTTQILALSLGVAVAALLLRIFASVSGDTILLTLSTFHHTFFALGVLTMLSMLLFLDLKDNDGEQMLF